jgi:cytochrome c peroxidase
VKAAPPLVQKGEINPENDGFVPPTVIPNGVLPGDQHFFFPTLLARGMEIRPIVDDHQRLLLENRYDLLDNPIPGVTMTRGKPVQGGVRVKLKPGTTFESLAAMTPDQIKAADLWPQGFFPLPHPNHLEGGMVFPHLQIEAVLAQTGRDLQRFDLDFDIPDIFLPEFPPPIFLTTRPDLGDVSQGLVVTTDNFFELFTRCTANGCTPILNPKQLSGLRLLLTPFAQQQFNLIDDRRVLRPQLGVACLDCHVNGHTNAATHTVGDIRPQANRHRIDTPTLRGVNVQRLFGSQRSLRSLEDFTEFEQRGAYFDGDPASAQKKGINFLDRGSQVQEMAEMQELFDFPPAPKLDIFGRLIPSRALPAELRGEAIFYSKGQCATCHPAPFFTDNSTHNLEVERFYKPRTIAGMLATADGTIKTFPLRGIKDSPPYLHDDRLLTLADTVEFFNLVLGVQLRADEKSDLVAFLLAL